MKTLYSFLVVLYLMLPTTFNAQIPSQLKAAYQAGLDQVVAEGDAIGLSVAVKVGDDVWAGAAGISAVDDTLTTASTFGVGSSSKTITSAVILKMMEDGLLSLDDPISMYLPPLNNIDGNITIKQLLNHTSGIFNYTEHPAFGFAIITQQNTIFTPEEVLSNFVFAPSFETGTKQEYSNTNYLLLGMIVKAISGQEFYEEARAQFNFDEKYPSLKMAPFEEDLSNLAHLWLDTTFSDQPLVDIEASGWTLNAFFSAAESAGGYVATPTDMVHWAHDLYSGALLSPASMDSLYDYHPFQLFGVVDYGLGVFRVDFTCGVEAVGHNGNILYTSSLYYVRAYDLAISVLTNDGSQLESLGGVDAIANELACWYDQATSTEELAQANEIKVFPNPFQDVFVVNYHLESTTDVRISVINELGATIFEEHYLSQLSGNHQLTIDQAVASGIYFVQLQIGEEMITKKVVALK